PPAAGPDLVDTARPYLTRLAADAGETCYLVVLEGNGTRFVAGAEGRPSGVCERTHMSRPIATPPCRASAHRR
ncbi:MAG TPA: hypothetical protein VGJ07_21280, partial [Rugosimonospora sp.]